MGKVRVELGGMKEFKLQVRNLVKEKAKEIDAELESATSEMRKGAIRSAPADQGILRGEITYKRGKDDFQWVLVSGAAYSAFVEFGTRSKVQIPPGLESFTEEVVNTKGTTSLSAKDAIFQWCKNKKIEEKFWYPIYIKLMRVGMTPHPFFFKQLEIVKPKLIRNIQNVLNG